MRVSLTILKWLAMTNVLLLLIFQGCLGAFDTIYYHEFKARLPGLGKQAAVELNLHAYRDFVYALLFLTLPWIAWQGVWAIILLALLGVEIVITMIDFVIEDQVRQPLGGVFPGERVTHALMGIIYGAMLAFLIPIIWSWLWLPTGLVFHSEMDSAYHLTLKIVMMKMALGVFLSGLRDWLAAREVSWAQWPWNK